MLKIQKMTIYTEAGSKRPV